MVLMFSLLTLQMRQLDGHTVEFFREMLVFYWH